MAEVVNIENSKYEFEILLIKRVLNPDSKEKEYKALPITKSSIKFLEISDDLVNFGYTGTITFSNYFGLLQKFGMYDIQDEAPLISIRFKNLDFEEAKKVAPPVYFIGSLGKNYETSSNVIDKHATFEFEEYTVAKLKRVTVQTVLQEEAIDSAFFQQGTSTDPKPSTNISDGNLTPVGFAQSFISSGLKLANITTNVKVVGTPTDDKGGAGDLDINQNKYSVFEVLQKLSNFLAFTLPDDFPGIFKDYVAPGIIKIENTSDYKEREIVIKSLVGEIRDFLKLIKNDKSSENIANYLTEKFVISLSNDPTTYRDNFIPKYDLIRVNYEDVYENKWCNLDIRCGTVDCTLNPLIPYEELRVVFENMFTAPFATNIPKRSDESFLIRENGLKFESVNTNAYSLPNIPDRLAIGFGTNALFKSFIFDNVALTFRVKGQPYRSAGKFIQIEADGSSSSTSSRSSSTTNELNGYWYIISVKHVFENDIYFNDYVCVKVYNNTGALSEIPTSSAINGSGTGASNLPLGGSSGIVGSGGGGNTGGDVTKAGDIIQEQNGSDMLDFVDETPPPDDQEGDILETWWPWPPKNETTSSAQQFWQTRSATPTKSDFVVGRRYRNQAEIDRNTPLPEVPTNIADEPTFLPPLEN
jgi:hypothetical protein